jgi:hypothetical protein
MQALSNFVLNLISSGARTRLRPRDLVCDAGRQQSSRLWQADSWEVSISDKSAQARCQASEYSCHSDGCIDFVDLHEAIGKDLSSMAFPLSSYSAAAHPSFCLLLCAGVWAIQRATAYSFSDLPAWPWGYRRWLGGPCTTGS